MRCSKPRFLFFFGAFLFATWGIFGVHTVLGAPMGEAYRLYLKGLMHERFGDVEQAMSAYEKVLGMDPEATFVHEAMASLALRLGEVDRALFEAKMVVSLEPENAESYMILGRVYLTRGDIEQATKSFDKALDLDPDHNEALLFAAHIRMMTVPSEALSFYDRFLENNPHSAEAWARVAELHQKAGDLESAQKSWKQVIEVTPNDFSAHLAMAHIHETLGDTASAIAAYQTVWELDPENAGVAARLGELLFRTGRIPESQEAFAQASRLNPEDTTIHFWLALLAEQRREWQEAIAHMEQVAKKSQEAGVLLRLAYYHSQIDEGRKALKVLRTLQKQDPGNPDFMYYVAMGYEDLGKPRGAIRWLKKVLEKDPTRSDAHFHMATNWDALNKFDNAVPHLKKTIELNPTMAVALNYLGYSYADRGLHLRKARDLIERALEIDPENGAFLDSMGWVFYKMERYLEAERFLKMAIDRVSDPVVWEHYGDVLIKLDKTEEALDAWHEGLGLDPKSKSLRKRIKNYGDTFFHGGDPKTLLRKVGAEFKEISTLVGFMELSGRGLARFFQVNGLFYYARPQNFRIEIMGPFFVPEALLVKNAEGLHLRPKQERRLAWEGQDRWLSLLGDFLSGEFLKKFETDDVKVRQRGQTIRWEAPFGELEIDRHRRVLTRLVWRGEEAGEHPALEMRFKRHEKMGKMRLPSLIICEMDNTRMALRLGLEQVKLNTKLDASLFDLSGDSVAVDD